jgi:DNA polymerase-3 subunit delta'
VNTRSDAEEGEKKAVTISVDQIRALGEFISLSSHQGGPKVVVIHPAEMLNLNAANALLKSLEEPPPGTHFLLLTHRPQQVLPTIKSRARQIALREPDLATGSAWLAAQGMRSDSELALAHTGNAPLLALELNDSEYWGMRDAFLRQLTAPDLDPLAAAEALRDFPIHHVVSWLQKWSYDLIYSQATNTVRYNPDHADALRGLGACIDPMAAVRFHREMVRLQRVVHHPLNARLFMSQLLLSYHELVQTKLLAA